MSDSLQDSNEVRRRLSDRKSLTWLADAFQWDIGRMGEKLKGGRQVSQVSKFQGFKG
jgi:hypothetical protein